MRLGDLDAAAMVFSHMRFDPVYPTRQHWMEIPHVDIHRERWQTCIVEDGSHRIVQNRRLDAAVRDARVSIERGIEMKFSTTGGAINIKMQVQSCRIIRRTDKTPVGVQAHYC